MNDARHRTISSARSSGAVGRNAIIPRLVHALRPQGTILDFGAGPEAIHTKALRAKGYNVTAFDLAANRRAIHDPKALERQYDVVFASNVLNVQATAGEVRMVLGLLGLCTKVGGICVFNYPDSPRFCPHVGCYDVEGFANVPFQSVCELTRRTFGIITTRTIFLCSRPREFVQQSNKYLINCVDKPVKVCHIG